MVSLPSWQSRGVHHCLCPIFHAAAGQHGQLVNVKTKQFCDTSSFFNLTTSKTKQVCETCSIFELDNSKSDTILRDNSIFERDNTSKTQQFCETSSTFELDNVKNEAIVRDFLSSSSWQHQKRSNSARLPSKMESRVQSWWPRTNALCVSRFFHSILKCCA